jgi:opacity protein-like surface antigen
MKKFALLALLALMASPAAHAADPATDARVQILKGQLEGFIENQKSMALKNGCKLDTKGVIAVEEADGYYAFTLPHITYTDAKGVRSELGMIAVNATPDTNNNWKISVALPTPISSYAPGGAEAFRTDIGAQNATGIWNEKLGHFTTVNANLGSIRLNDLITQNTVTVNGLTIASNLAEQDPEAYTGAANVILSSISFYNAGTNFNGTIPSIALKTNLADRASKTPMTKEQVKNRPLNKYPDGYNIFAFLFGAPERVTGTITGLDVLNGQLQQTLITAKPDQKQNLLQAILGVSAVSGMGRPVPNDANSKSYDVVFGKDGNVTLNGTELGSLTKMQPVGGLATTAGMPVLR